MKIYKVVVIKTVFVEAEDEDEAKDLALDGEYIMLDESIESVEVSSRSKMRRMMLG